MIVCEREALPAGTYRHSEGVTLPGSLVSSLVQRQLDDVYSWL